MKFIYSQIFVIISIFSIIVSTPIFEQPEIIKKDSPANEHFDRRSLNLNRSSEEREALDKQIAATNLARNDLVRSFDLSKVSTWVENLNKDKVDQMNANDLNNNLNSIRTVSTQVQTQIHDICSNITDKMKLYDIKIKEIEVLEKKMKEEKNNLRSKPHQKTNKTKELKKKLSAQKSVVKDTVKEVLSHQDKFYKLISSYNRHFAIKNKENIKNLLNDITLQLKGYMKDSHFHETYKQFMATVVKKIQTLSSDTLKDSFGTAKLLINNYFLKIHNGSNRRRGNKKIRRRR